MKLRPLRPLAVVAALLACLVPAVPAEEPDLQDAVGFITVRLPAGHSLFTPGLLAPAAAGQVEANRVADLFATADLPSGAHVIKHRAGAPVTNTLTVTVTGTVTNRLWSEPDMTLSLGEGAVIFTPAARAVTVVGRLVTGTLPNYVPAGASLRGPLVAAGGAVSGLLGLPVTEGLKVSGLGTNGVLQLRATYTGGRWEPVEPVLAPGEALHLESPTNLVWTYTLPPEGATNDVAFTTQPAGASAAPGGAVTLTVAATADGPLRYQWQHRGDDVPGATNATLTLAGLTAAQAGDYWVAAYSRNGWRRSALATVTVTGGGGAPADLDYSFNPATRRLTITVGGPPGAQYRLEGSDDFASWTNVITLTAGGSHEVPVSEAYQFYRAVLVGGGPANPATLAIAAGAAGMVNVTVTGAAGARYTLEKAPSPAGPYGVHLSGVLSGTVVSVTNTAAGNAGGFLRARSE
jgi:hypothetical protein